MIQLLIALFSCSPFLRTFVSGPVLRLPQLWNTVCSISADNHRLSVHSFTNVIDVGSHPNRETGKTVVLACSYPQVSCSIVDRKIKYSELNGSRY